VTAGRAVVAPWRAVARRGPAPLSRSLALRAVRH